MFTLALLALATTALSSDSSGPSAQNDRPDCYTQTRYAVKGGQRIRPGTFLNRGVKPTIEQKLSIDNAIQCIERWEVVDTIKQAWTSPNNTVKISEALKKEICICIADEKAAKEFPECARYFPKAPKPDPQAKVTGKSIPTEFIEEHGGPAIHIRASYVPLRGVEDYDMKIAALAGYLVHETWHHQIPVDRFGGYQDPWEVGAYSWTLSALFKLLPYDNIDPVEKKAIHQYVSKSVKQISDMVDKMKPK